VTQRVRLEVADGVGTIRLDNPPRNTIDVVFAERLHEVAREASRREDVRAVVVWGGARIFSAGGDVALMSDRSKESVRPIISALGDALVTLEEIPKVVIAAVNGMCLGGGCEIALAADFRYAAENALFGQPEIRFGIMPGAGATQRLPRIVGVSAAKDLIYSGRRVRAREALDLRLVDRVLPAAEVYPAALEAAATYARGPAAALGAAKTAIDAGVAWSPGVGLDLELDLVCGLFDTEDQKEGMRAFLASRPPVFE
jgi:enoyl-CoA hydratase/carnithine racemase